MHLLMNVTIIVTTKYIQGVSAWNET